MSKIMFKRRRKLWQQDAEEEVCPFMSEKRR